jgi:hypothetical protein
VTLPSLRFATSHGRGLRAGVTVLTLVALAVTACSGGAPLPNSPTETGPQAADQRSEWTWTPQAEPLELGVTHTKDSLNPGEPDAARRRGTAILGRDVAVWQNHHLMGFGTLNPEPAPGEFDWESLDRRMALTEATGGRSVLTLCCAPDWMKGGEPGRTDWSRIEAEPLPEHFDDFARLSAAAVARYPQVERVLVWNELKGFYRAEPNRWDYEGYTQLYNKVYRAVKEVRPEVQIGGPYVVMNSFDPGSGDSSDLRGPWGVVDERALDVVDYWLKHNVGADFVAVDGSTKTRNGTRPRTVDVGAQKFAAIDRWLRARTSLPIWWAEFYPDLPEGVPAGPTSSASASATLAAVAAYAESGAQAALLWGPQGHEIGFSALWTDSTRKDGGRPTPLTEAWRWLVPRLAEQRLEIGRSTTRPLVAFRADDGTLVVNMSQDPVDVPEHGVSLAGWASAVSPRGL